MDKNLLIRSDCKEALQKLINDGVKVDLIYLDPPFNSSRTYNLIYSKMGITAQSKAFHDMWEYNSQSRQMLLNFENLIDTMDELSDLVKNFLKVWIAPLKSGNMEDKKMLIYLIYMTERLVLMKKILKDTGSIYYHCDPTASHYIKIIMDGIFGRDNFRNEIIWGYDTAGRSKKYFQRKHDNILSYVVSKKPFFDGKKVSVEMKSGKNSFGGRLEVDEEGRKYRLVYGTKNSKGESKYYKYYLDEGKIPNDYWVDIPALQSKDNERTGYSTQKPVALLDRIIKSSCPEGGIVLDPFCGCGTTIASSVNNKVNWIGIDISYDATDVIKDRLKNHLYVKEDEYNFIDGSPETKKEYDKLDAFAKQDWLIRKLGGFPNPRKTGDDGIDGDLKIHLGTDKDKLDKWGTLLFSVKTGKQCNPAMIRELIGTVRDKGANMGVLILDSDPSDNMIDLAQRQGEIEYYYKEDMPPNKYYKIQIITSQEIIDNIKLPIPPTLKEIKLFREDKMLLI